MARRRYSRSGFGLYQAATWVLTTLSILSAGIQVPYPEQHQVTPSVGGGFTEFFQLYRPLLVPLTNTTSPNNDFSGEACSQLLLQHEFINSYGKPAVAQYSPPRSCEWNTVYFHLHTTSKGRQYDRLAFLFFDNTEVWRTSTAEPIPDGIYFRYTKDLTHFNTLLRGNGALILDMGNMVTDILTGTFAVSLTAHYFKLDLPPQHRTADVILPVSRMQGSNGQPSHFVLPNDVAKTEISVPGHVKKAIFSVIASGNSDEEFWYMNVPDELVDSFPNNALLGHSSYREVQVYVDGVMVDAIMPVPTIYTGGVNPGLWKPVVCPHAFDLWEFELDITLWVAGKTSAVIELRVEGLRNIAGHPEIGGGIGQNWYVSGRTFIWTDPEAPQINASEYMVTSLPAEISVSWTVDGDGENRLVNYQTSVHRKTIISRDSASRRLLWHRLQRYGMKSTLSAYGNNQTLWANTQVAEGFETSTYKGDTPSSRSFQRGRSTSFRETDFSLGMDQAYIVYPDKSFFIYGKVNSSYMNHGPKSTLLTDQSALSLSYFSEKEIGVDTYSDHKFVDGEASYFSASTGSNKTSSIHGTSHQGYYYEIGPGSFTTERTIKKYKRDTRSVYARILSDFQSINDVPLEQYIPNDLDFDDRKASEVESREEEFICPRLSHRRGKSICPVENLYPGR